MARKAALLFGLWVFALAAIGWVRSSAAVQEKPPKPRLASGSTAGRSIGSPTDGRLEGGIVLAPRRELKLKNPQGARWGLPALVGLLERSAERIAQRFPGSTLVVGDLSRKQGGEIAGHRSHESGRDADVGF